MEKGAKYGLTEVNTSLTIHTNCEKISCRVLHLEVRYGVHPEFHIKIYMLLLSHCS